MIWGLGGPEEDTQLPHCCWTGRVGEREEEEGRKMVKVSVHLSNLDVRVGIVG